MTEETGTPFEWPNIVRVGPLPKRPDCAQCGTLVPDCETVCLICGNTLDETDCIKEAKDYKQRAKSAAEEANEHAKCAKTAAEQARADLVRAGAAANAAQTAKQNKPRFALFAGGAKGRATAAAEKAEAQRVAAETAANDAGTHATTAQKAADEAGKHAKKARDLPMRDKDQICEQADGAEACRDAAKAAADQADSCQGLAKEAADEADEAAQVVKKEISSIPGKTKQWIILIVAPLGIVLAIFLVSLILPPPTPLSCATLTQPNGTPFAIGTPIPIEAEVTRADIVQVDVLFNKTPVVILKTPASPGKFVVATEWITLDKTSNYYVVDILCVNEHGVVIATTSGLFPIATPQPTPTVKP